VNIKVDDVHVNSPRSSNAIRDDARGYDASRGVGHDSDDKGRNDFARQKRDADGDYNSRTHKSPSDSSNNTAISDIDFTVSDIDFTVKVRSSCGKWNGYDTGFITFWADISVQDWSIHNRPYSNQKNENAGNYDIATDEPLILYQREDFETYIDVIENENNANSQKVLSLPLQAFAFGLINLKSNSLSKANENKISQHFCL